MYGTVVGLKYARYPAVPDVRARGLPIYRCALDGFAVIGAEHDKAADGSGRKYQEKKQGRFALHRESIPGIV